jgi:hypothetical protein
LEFTPIQFEIVKLLENSQCVKGTSQNIASIWYTHNLNQLKGHQNVIPDMVAGETSTDDGSLKEYLGFLVDTKRFLEIEDFKMFDIRNPIIKIDPRLEKRKTTLTWMNPELVQAPNVPPSWSLTIFGERMKQALKKVPTHLEVQDFRKVDSPPGTGFFFHHSYDDEPDENKLQIIFWPMRKQETLTRRNEITRLFSIYSRYMDYYSGQILAYLEQTFHYTDSTVSPNHLMDWFSEALFCIPSNSLFKLPLIGRSTLNLPLSPDHLEYHPVQLSIVEPLLLNGRYKYLEHTLALVGYWLKHFRTNLWQSYIKSDENYSVLLYQAFNKQIE